MNIHNPPQNPASPGGNGTGRRNKPRRTPKGRQVDPIALSDIQALLGDAPVKRDLLIEWIEECEKNGVQCFIAGAGGAAHLAGVVAAQTPLPVLGVPMPSKHLGGFDSLLSMVQMPKGIPVATFAIGDAGAANAALFAVAMLALSDANVAKKLEEFRDKQTRAVLDAELPPLR